MDLPRSSGILLHPTSLPSRFHVGDLGPGARQFIDRLADARQSWWQILPLNPPGYAGSPYGSSSTFALSTMLLDPLWLLEKGWISESDLASFEARQPEEGDLIGLQAWKEEILDQAYQGWIDSGESSKEMDQFYEDNEYWLRDFTLFSALSQSYHSASWYSWPQTFVLRDPHALEAVTELHYAHLDRSVFSQWVIDQQWREVREYARARNVKLIGDLPIFVSMDSADVWAHRAVFRVTSKGACSVVAGVPPDYFSETGQKWGNPLYDWEHHFEEVMSWWLSRVSRVRDLVDLIRIDHFRAFADYWEVPVEAPTAEVGEWREGPGDLFFDRVREALGEVPFIAEDLGVLSDEAVELRERQNLPGMKILMFAFDGDSEHAYLPHNYPELCVAYPGTHDNNTLIGWIREDASPSELHEARVYLSSSDEDLPRKMMEALFDSEARLVILQVQDLMGLDESARMNVPGVPTGNWVWRLPSWALDPQNQDAVAKWLWLKTVTCSSDRVSNDREDTESD